jgi:hypothetical protein
MSNRIRRLGGRWLAPLSSLTVLAILWWKSNASFEDLGPQLARADLKILAGTLVFSAFWHTVLGADKWWRILRAMGAQVSFWEVFRVRMGSDPIRIAVPMKGGEVVNVAYFARLESFGFGRAAGSVVFDKALNFFGEVFWLYIGIAAMAKFPTPGYIVLHSAIGAAVFLLFCVRPARQLGVATATLLHPKLGRLATGVLSAFEEFSWWQKVGFLSYGAVFQIRPLAVCGLVLLAFDPVRPPTLPELLVLGSVVVLVSNLPSMAGVGPREAALMAMFAGFADQATLLSVGLLMSLIVQVLPAALGIPFMFPLLRELTVRAGPPASP